MDGSGRELRRLYFLKVKRIAVLGFVRPISGIHSISRIGRSCSTGRIDRSKSNVEKTTPAFPLISLNGNHLLCKWLGLSSRLHVTFPLTFGTSSCRQQP